MAFPFVSSAMKTALKSQFPAGERFYLDFRQQEYPPISGHNLVYKHVSSGDNQPGSHVAQLFAAGTNLVTSPEDLTSGWTASNVTAALAAYYHRGRRFTAITATALNGYAYQNVTFTGDGVKAFQAILRRGTDTVTSILVQDTSAAATRLNVAVTWATNSVAAATGTLWFSEWLDADTVWVAAVSTAITAANTNQLRIGYLDNGTYVYATAVQATDSAYPTPYMATTRSAAAPYYVLPMASTFSLRIKFRPWFNYDIATFPNIINWYNDATHRFLIGYNSASDTFQIYWVDGGTARALNSQRYDDGTSYSDINTWITLDVAVNLTTGTTAGSQLWTDRTSRDTTWSGNIDVKASNFPVLSVGHEAGANQGACEVAYIWYCPDKVITSTDVTANWSTVKEETVVWGFNGEGVGRTRCNVTSNVLSHSLDDREGYSASQLSLLLLNNDGQFSDDQYGAFDPANEIYNGTAVQAYMQARCRLEAEAWYGDTFDTFFSGRLDPMGFSRQTSYNKQSRVTITADDRVAEIAEYVQSVAASWADYELSNTDEDSSLLHVITRLATKPLSKWYNYLANSSFENATIANSWTATTPANLTRQAGGLFGSYCGQYVYDAGTGGTQTAFQQIVTFTGTLKLNIGETWTAFGWLKSASNCASDISLDEHDSGGENDGTDAAWSVTGGAGWTFAYVTHTVTDSTSDRLRVLCSLDDNVTLQFDGWHLVQHREPLNWFILNNNDGSSAIESADDADRDTFDSLGFDVDYVLYESDGTTALQHPWAVVNYNEAPWEHLQEIGTATAARALCISRGGALKFRCHLATGYQDPATLETITTHQQSITSTLQARTANKWIVHGVKVVKDSYIRLLWTLDAVELFPKDAAGKTNQSIANGGTLPDETSIGALWAKYSEQRLGGGNG